LRGLLRQGRLRLELTVVKVGRALGLLPRGLHARQHLRLRVRRRASPSKRTRCHIHKPCAACLAHADCKSPRPSVAARKQPRRRARACHLCWQPKRGAPPGTSTAHSNARQSWLAGKGCNPAPPLGPARQRWRGTGRTRGSVLRSTRRRASCASVSATCRAGRARHGRLLGPAAAPHPSCPQHCPAAQARTGPRLRPPPPPRGGGRPGPPRQATQRPGRWQLQHGPRRMQHTQARRAERGQARARKTDTAPGRSRRTVAAPCTSRRRMTSVPRASASVTCARPPAPRRAPTRAPRGAAAAPQRACA